MLRVDPAGRVQAETWRAAHPEVESVTFAVADLNGTFRGKRAPVGALEQALASGIRMPLSALAVDVWGADVSGSAFVFGTGDADGICISTGRGPLASPWADPPAAFVPMWMARDNGTPFEADPRVVLSGVVERFHRAGYTPVVAIELEFYLFDPAGPQPEPPRSPWTGQRVRDDDVLSVDELDAFAPFLEDVQGCCEAQGIPVVGALAEGGAGHFEINLGHVADPLRAADDAMLFKRIVKGFARKHGWAATFMAKPYPSRSGSGLHVHFSLLGEDGRNVFDDGSDAGSTTLRSAVAGLIEAMPETMLLLAPHMNSYRRLRPGSHAPAASGWGYENRTTAIRIPGGAPAARRIEHRVAGADANPYLVLAAVLAAALSGIEQQLKVPEPVRGNAYQQDLPPLPQDWASALEAFARGARVPEMVGPTLQRMLVGCKEQEMNVFARQVSGFEYRTYLDIV